MATQGKARTTFEEEVFTLHMYVNTRLEKEQWNFHRHSHFALRFEDIPQPIRRKLTDKFRRRASEMGFKGTTTQNKDRYGHGLPASIAVPRSQIHSVFVATMRTNRRENILELTENEARNHFRDDVRSQAEKCELGKQELIHKYGVPESLFIMKKIDEITQHYKEEAVKKEKQCVGLTEVLEFLDGLKKLKSTEPSCRELNPKPPGPLRLLYSFLKAVNKQDRLRDLSRFLHCESDFRKVKDHMKEHFDYTPVMRTYSSDLKGCDLEERVSYFEDKIDQVFKEFDILSKHDETDSSDK